MQKEIADAVKRKKTTVLMVTHDLEEAVFLADKIFIMSPRPSRIDDVMEIRLPKPRKRADKAFIVTYAKVLKALSSTPH